MITHVRIDMELDRNGGDGIDQAIQKNMNAMQWAIDHCPASYLAPMVDNKAIVERVLQEYRKQESL